MTSNVPRSSKLVGKGPRLNFGLFSLLDFFVFRVSWQVQYFVDLAKHISWQVQDFVGLGAQISWQAQDFVDLEVQISWQVQYFVYVELQKDRKIER